MKTKLYAMNLAVTILAGLSETVLADEVKLLAICHTRANVDAQYTVFLYEDDLEYVDLVIKAPNGSITERDRSFHLSPRVITEGEYSGSKFDLNLNTGLLEAKVNTNVLPEGRHEPMECQP